MTINDNKIDNHDDIVDAVVENSAEYNAFTKHIKPNNKDESISDSLVEEIIRNNSVVKPK